jgi:hypothetical protein
MKREILCKMLVGVLVVAPLVTGLSAAAPSGAIDARVVGGACVPCAHNTVSHQCASPCASTYHNCLGDGLNVCVSTVYCKDSAGCSKDTQVSATDCVDSI